MTPATPPSRLLVLDSGASAIAAAAALTSHHTYSDACACVFCADQRKANRGAAKRQLLKHELAEREGAEAKLRAQLQQNGSIVNSVDGQTQYRVAIHANKTYTVSRAIPKVRGKAARKAAKRARRQG